jgi:outer membrane lipoprotein SlyB
MADNSTSFGIYTNLSPSEVQELKDAQRAVIGAKDIKASDYALKNLKSLEDYHRDRMFGSSSKFSKELPKAQAMADEIRKINRGAAPSVKELTRASGGMNTLGNVIGPAIAVAQGATVAQGIMDKMKAGESFKEAASNPELVKDAARGVLGYMGANAGALAGSMAPGGLPAKAAAELAGAVGVGYAGSKLADLLTGNPVVDKIIRARYEQARNERMAKTKPTAASSVGLRPGE